MLQGPQGAGGGGGGADGGGGGGLGFLHEAPPPLTSFTDFSKQETQREPTSGFDHNVGRLL